MEFKKWPSIPRLSKEKAVVTEKIDGSNSCIRIRPFDVAQDRSDQVDTVSVDGYSWIVWAQSRTRMLQPVKSSDNFGFAAWVYEHAVELVDILGPGDHYGEWWGSKIQCGYGLTNGERRFSLFNAPRWNEAIDIYPGSTEVKELCTVPMLYSGPFIDMDLTSLREDLLRNGSEAMPGFKAEGMVLYLRELDASYKILLDKDDQHKWEIANGS